MSVLWHWPLAFSFSGLIRMTRSVRVMRYLSQGGGGVNVCILVTGAKEFVAPSMGRDLEWLQKKRVVKIVRFVPGSCLGTRKREREETMGVVGKCHRAMFCHTLIMFYEGQSIWDSRQDFIKN